MPRHLAPSELDAVLVNTDLEDLRPFAANCASVAAGVGRVVAVDGYFAVYAEDEFLHMFVQLGENLFDATGKRYNDPTEAVAWIQNYSPFDEDYAPEHFPLHPSLVPEDMDEFLLDEFTKFHADESGFPVSEHIASETAQRLRTTLDERGR